MFIKQFEFIDHSGPVYCITKYNNTIYSSGADRFIVRWDLTNLKQDDFVIKLEYSAYSILHLLHVPLLVIGCSNGDLHLINTNEKKEIKFIQHHKSAIFTIVEIPEKQLIITGDAEGNVCIWNSSKFSLLLQIPLNSGKIRAIEYLNNELVIGSKDGIIRFFELVFFNQIAEIPINSDGIQSLKINGNNTLIGGYDGYLYVLDSVSKSLISRIPAHKGPIYSIIQLNEHNFVSASRDKTIKIWDSNSLNVLEKKEFKSGGHRNSVNHIVGLTEHKFVSCSDDSQIIGWTKE
jgi:WD40 repeat protein